MIIEHYEVFKTQFDSSELNQKNWDILRTESGESAYAIEDSTKEYERNCKEAVSYEISSKYIADILKKQRCKHVVSLGEGKGILEWHLKKQMPDLYIECADYAESAIEKLKTVFVDGDDFHRFDMLKGDYQIFNKDAFFIMYRVSEEFCYSDWCKIFKKMKENGIKNILFIPDMLATENLEIHMKKRHAKNAEQGIKDIFCGWIYSEDVLEEMFQTGEYEIAERHSMGELVLYMLK